MYMHRCTGEARLDQCVAKVRNLEPSDVEHQKGQLISRKRIAEPD